MNEMFVKVCGITRLDDARHAIDEGATALGFILWPDSPRFVATTRVAEIVAALPSLVATVGVFVNMSPEGIAETMRETGLTMVQLHGDEPDTYAAALKWPIVRSVTLATAEEVLDAWPAETLFLVDAADRKRRGGTGQAVDWAGAEAVARRRRTVLAGGLTPDNVETAVARVRPYGVDVSSGVEEAPGLKDWAKVARFCAAARHALAHAQVMEK